LNDCAELSSDDAIKDINDNQEAMSSWSYQEKIVMHITNTSTMAADEAHLFHRECLERS
jgi:hypothetical protein